MSEVHRLLDKALNLLRDAERLERASEEQRIQKAIRRDKNYGFPDEGVLRHDPLGRRLGKIADSLEQLLQ